MEDKIVFNNIPNERIQFRYTSQKGKQELDYFISRAVAVVGVVFAIPTVGGIQVLITKRSKRMRDEAGKYGVPCGYMDWKESGYEGMVREVYEETSLYLPKYKKYLLGNNKEQPFFVQSDPNKDARQNISLLYFSVYDFHEAMNEFPIDIEKYTDHETAEVKWIPLIDFFGRYADEYNWAFHHDETIKQALKFYNKLNE